MLRTLITASLLTVSIAFAEGGTQRIVFDVSRTEHTWALKALSSELPSDWSGYRYFVFELRASTPQRFEVRIHTPNGVRTVWMRLSVRIPRCVCQMTRLPIVESLVSAEIKPPPQVLQQDHIQNKQLVYEVRFDYVPASPVDAGKGWKKAYGAGTPTFRTDPDVAGSLRARAITLPYVREMALFCIRSSPAVVPAQRVRLYGSGVETLA